MSLKLRRRLSLRESIDRMLEGVFRPFKMNTINRPFKMNISGPPEGTPVSRDALDSKLRRLRQLATMLSGTPEAEELEYEITSLEAEKLALSESSFVSN